MTKDEFLEALNNGLKKLRTEEREEIIRDFEEHFSHGYTEGKTDRDIIASLGSPENIVKEIMLTYDAEQVKETPVTGSLLRTIWLVIGLGFLNLVVVLGPVIGLFGLIIGIWAAGASFIVSPAFVLINVLIYQGTFALSDLFFSILLCGLGLFLIIGIYFVTKIVYNMFIRYVTFNVKLVKGGF